MASSSAKTSSRVSKPVVREDEVDPTMVLLSGDGDDQGHGLTCLYGLIFCCCGPERNTCMDWRASTLLDGFLFCFD